MFCRRIQIPFRVFAFSDAYHRRDKDGHISNFSRGEKVYGRPLKGADEDGYRISGATTAEFSLENLSLLEIFNEKMSNMEFTEQLENFLQITFSMDEGYYYRGTSFETRFDNGWCVPRDLNLGGTPLDHAIICIRDYLKDFKSQSGLDICTFVALTDGCSHTPFHRNRAVLVDRKYNQTYELYDKTNRYDTRTTHELLKWLKKTAGVRTVGFYLTKSVGRRFGTDSKDFCGHELDQWDNEAELNKKRLEYNKLSTVFENGCYDLSIVINQKKIGLDYDQDELNVKDGATKGQLKNALVKAGNSKMKQRIILNKFVEQMAV